MEPIFQAAQEAVNIVNTSSHPQNRIAATIFHETDEWWLSHVNYWPAAIENTLGREQRIGNASGTVHAETAAIFKAAFEQGRSVSGASIAVTDPPCPNCVKNMAEAGINNIYVDHKGFLKDFAQRRIDEFNTLSVKLAEKAGISMYEVNRKEQTIKPITIADKDYMPFDESPVLLIDNEEDFRNFNALDLKTKTAFAYVRNKNKIQIFCISHPALGYGSKKDNYEIEHPETKYSFIQEAGNRLLMTAAKHGFQILNSALFMSEVPTSREFVNMVGAGIKTLHIKQINVARDADAFEALEILKKHNIVSIIE